MNNLTIAYEQTKRLDDAARTGDELLAVMQAREPESLRTAVTSANVARVQAKIGNYARAEALARDAVRIAQATFPPESPAPARFRHTVGIAMVGAGKVEAGTAELESAYAEMTTRAKPSDALVTSTAKMVQGFMETIGRTEDAARWKERAERN
jgi:hypothetical protein